MKKCSTCKIDKPFTSFYTHKRDGLQSKCKDCNKTYNEARKQKQKEYNSKWRVFNKDYKNEKDKEYRIKNKSRISENRKEYYQANKEKIKANTKLYREKNKNKYSYYKKVWEAKNKDNELYKLRRFVRYSAWRALKSKKEVGSIELLGCSLAMFRSYITEKFKPGMTWDNYGKWHIDHILPLASAKTKEDIIKLCHFTNLQPLWAAENFKKGKSLIVQTSTKDK